MRQIGVTVKAKDDPPNIPDNPNQWFRLFTSLMVHAGMHRVSSRPGGVFCSLLITPKPMSLPFPSMTGAIQMFVLLFIQLYIGRSIERRVRDAM